MASDFFNLLKKDHEKVKKILDQLNKTSTRALKKREDLFVLLKQELQPHMEAEENVYYPALMNGKQARMTTLESIEEHHAAKLVLSELETTPKDNEVWAAKLKVFKELLEHHIQEEEHNLFDVTKTVLDKQKIKNIMNVFQQTKEQVKMNMIHS